MKNLKTPIHFFKTTEQATERYTHVAKNAIDRIKSTLDELKINDE